MVRRGELVRQLDVVLSYSIFEPARSEEGVWGERPQSGVWG